MKGNVNYLELANSPLMWVGAAIAVGIVVFQSVLFFRKSLKAAKEIGIEQEKINMAIKSSAISSIGPSIVILQCNPGNNDLPDRINGSTCFMDEAFFHRIR